MTIGNITTGQQTVTATGAVALTTGLDVSGITGDFTVHLRIQGLTAASGTPGVCVQIEGTTNAFSATQALIVKQVKGPITAPSSGSAGYAEQHFSWRKYELYDAGVNFFGTASAKVRVNVTSLDGTTPSLTLDSWVEY